MKFGPVFFLPSENRGRYPNCHSIYIDGPGIIIDPASNRERLVQIRDEYGVNEVWLSHAHEDHIKYLGLFEDLPLALSEPDAPAMAHVENLLSAYGVEGHVREYWRNFVEDNFGFRPRTASRFLRPGDIIDLGTVTVEVIGTPGHTPGHLSFFFREPRVLFMGDYDLTKFGPWYADVFGSIQGTIHSINRLRHWPAKVWLVSHETGVFEEAPGRRWDDYLGVITVREEKLLNLLKKPRSFEEIVDACIVYWRHREPSEFYDLGERGHMAKHLEKLMGENRVARVGQNYVAV